MTPSTSDDLAFAPPPRQMRRERFVARFGAIYEHSPWVAERAWDAGLSAGSDRVAGLAATMAAVVAAASEEEKLALISAHPDLAGRLALRGELGAHSAVEQASAGLDSLSAADFARFQNLNTAYRQRFGFPFVIAVRGLTPAAILAAFEKRLENDRAREIKTALAEIDKIARLRLKAMVAEG